MAVKKGLGKGLGNLIPESDKEAQKTKVVEKVVEKKVIVKEPAETIVKINEVEPNKNQPRRTFDEDALLELAESIKQHGVIQPLIVKKRDKYYEIIAGERRWRAAKMAGLKEIPIVIKDLSDQEIMEVALIENIQREDLNPIEEAQAYQRLIKEYNYKQDELAERVSKSRTAVTNSMRLLKLCDEVQQMVIEDMLSTGHARALLAIENPEEQYNIAQKVFDEKLSVRDVEKLVKNLHKPEKAKKKIDDEALKIIYQEIEEKLKQALSTKVSITGKEKGAGKMEIEFYSHEDLDRLVDLLTKA